MAKIMHIKKNTRGSYIIEAAIVLPLVIVGGLTLAHVIYSVYLTENIAYIASDESKNLSIESYDKKVSLGFPYKVENRVLEENEKVIGTNLKNFGYLYRYQGFDGIISFDIEYVGVTNLPLDFVDEFSNMDSFMFRGYIGKKMRKNPASFQELEGDGVSVWVFPESGKKYHKENCTYVKSNTRRGILTGGVISKYDSCNTCDSHNARPGSLIYYFPKHGESYHFEGCKTIDKYIIEIEQKSAIEDGYSPCLKCGGS